MKWIMNKIELQRRIKNEKLDQNGYEIVLDRYTSKENTIACYVDGGMAKIYKITETGRFILVKALCNQFDVYNELYRYLIYNYGNEGE